MQMILFPCINAVYRWIWKFPDYW